MTENDFTERLIYCKKHECPNLYSKRKTIDSVSCTFYYCSYYSDNPIWLGEINTCPRYLEFNKKS